MPKTYSNDLRSRIVSDRKEGLSYPKLAEKYSLSISGARKICIKFETTGCIKNLPFTGRSRKTSLRDDKMIVRQARKKSTMTAREIGESLKLEVSTRTIQRRLKSGGLESRLQTRKPLISTVNKKKRLNFVKQYIDKDSPFWDSILWSDESKFELFGSKKRQRVWRKKGEGLLDQNLKKTVKHGGGSIMVWGCFAANGVGELVLVEGIMTGASYVELVRNNVQKSARKLHLGRRFVFQQDNDPKHTSKIAKEYFKKSKINVLDWPPQSPDLNPIEILWSILEAKIPKHQRRNKTEFFVALKEAWESIDIDTTSKLVRSLPRRLAAVRKNKGGATKY